jgi:hypothetical protein
VSAMIGVRGGKVTRGGGYVVMRMYHTDVTLL